MTCRRRLSPHNRRLLASRDRLFNISETAIKAVPRTVDDGARMWGMPRTDLRAAHRLLALFVRLRILEVERPDADGGIVACVGEFREGGSLSRSVVRPKLNC
jgi:hypothetical protein